jgi:7-cyano-7-deazaguanine synthase
MKNKLIILSGGMDSTVALYDFKDTIGLAVTFNYGSKHNEAEIQRAVASCEKLDIPHMVIELKEAFLGFKSDLLKSGGEIPEGHYEDENMSKTVVPFRNGIMLAIAAGLAESHELTHIMLASHAGDHAVYPDCRPDFNSYMSKAISVGTSNNVKIYAPYSKITKEEIAFKGRALGIDWRTTYSCYKGGEVHCGRCSTCVERIWALRKGPDLTEYLDHDYAETLLREKGEW